jgi:hypothetical protein
MRTHNGIGSGTRRALAAFTLIVGWQVVSDAAVAGNSAQSSSPNHSAPALRTDYGNHSFRGLVVRVGDTSPAFDITVSNGGSSPVTGLKAAAHGDFVVTRSSCPTELSGTCTVSVAFRPSVAGPSTGSLEITGDGVTPMVVPLDAGTPISFGAIPIGEAALRWVTLSTMGPLSGEITGPFGLALQDPYAYATIDGVNFAASARAASASGDVSLGVQFKATAPGEASGMVTLSNGTTYHVSAVATDDVVGDISLSTSTVDLQTVTLGSASGPAPVILKNGSTSSLAIQSVSATAPFSASSTCGKSLAAGASCTVHVVFRPTALGASTGELSVTVGKQLLTAFLTGSAQPNPENAIVSPESLFFNLAGAGALSSPQIITVTNGSATQTMTVQGFDGTNICSTSVPTDCFKVDSNDCAAVAPSGHCQIQLQYSFGAAQGGVLTNTNLVIVRGDSAATYTIYGQIGGSSSTNPTLGLTLSPSSLIFGPTPVGGASAPQLLTLTNTSAVPLFIDYRYMTTANEFSTDSACGILDVGASCTLHVRYLPLGAGSSGIRVNGVFVEGDPLSIYDATSGYASVELEGYGLPTTALASPSYPPLEQPVIQAETVPGGTPVKFSLPVKNTGTSPLVISNIALGGLSPGAAYYSVDPGECAAPIAPGATCSLHVLLDQPCVPNPYQPGDCYADTNLTLESNAASSPDSYEMTGVATPNSDDSLNIPTLSTEGPFDFGRVQLGTSASQTFTYKASVDNPIPTIGLTGDSGFHLTNGCAAVVRSTTASCTVQIDFTPTATGFQHGALTLASIGGLATTTLSAAAIPAQLKITPTSLTFAPTVVYQSPPNRTVTFTNITGAPLTLGTLHLTNLNFTAVSNSCGKVLAADAHCAVTVAFSPNNFTGVLSGNLVFPFGVDDGLVNVPMTAPVTSLAMTPSAVNFGTVAVGRGASKTITVRNIGTAGQLYSVASISGTALSGAKASAYKIAANTCIAGSTLSGTQTCSITVQFTPAEVGTFAATLTLSTSNAGMVSAALTGSGGASAIATADH